MNGGSAAIRIRSKSVPVVYFHGFAVCLDQAKVNIPVLYIDVTIEDQGDACDLFESRTIGRINAEHLHRFGGRCSNGNHEVFAGGRRRGKLTVRQCEEIVEALG